MKLKILICDDVEQHRYWMKAALINAPIASNEQKRIDFVNTVFEIFEFQIVGEAIQALERGLIVDLALVDADFCNLPSEFIQDKGFEVLIEKTSLRGFDLLEAMQKYLPFTPTFLFTGYAGNKRDILNEIISRKLDLGKDWFFMPQDKGYGIQYLAQDMPFLLKKSAEKIFQGLSPIHKHSLRVVLDSVPSTNMLMDLVPEINKRKIQIRNLLIGWASVKTNLKGELELNIENPDRILKELISFKAINEFKPLGIWKGGVKSSKNFDYMVNARSDYQQDAKYLEWKDEINKKAASLVLEAIKNYTEIIRGRFYPSIIINKHNCKYEKEDVTISNEVFRNKFFNALVARRFAIGFVKIRDSHNNNFDDELVLTTIASVLGRKTNDDDDEKTITNLKQFFNEILGLSVQLITGEKKLSQKLNYTIPKIMDEENDWLKKYIPQIEDRINNNDWRSFMD